MFVVCLDKVRCGFVGRGWDSLNLKGGGGFVVFEKAYFRLIK